MGTAADEMASEMTAGTTEVEMWCGRPAPGPKANYITPKQFKELLEHVPDLKSRKWPSSNIRICYYLAYACALRISEALQVRGRNFDWGRGELYLGKTKTKSNFVAVPPWARGRLQGFFSEWGDDDPILPGCSRQTVYRWLLKAGQDLDIEALATEQVTSGEKSITHVFRKSLAKDMLWGRWGRKANIAEVQAQLRHENPIITGKYLRLGYEGAAEFWGSTEP